MQNIADLAIDLYGAQIAPVLALRPAWLEHIDALQTAIFGDAGLDSASRSSLLAVASHCGIHPALRKYLSLDAISDASSSNPPSKEIEAFLSLLFLSPGATQKNDLEQLTHAGKPVRDSVLLAQAAAFLSYLSRLLYGLSIFAEPTANSAEEPVAGSAQLNRSFTLQPLRWEPWLPPVKLESADREQLQVLEACGAIHRDSPYFRLLVHHPASLAQRTALYNAILFDRDGLSRSEREFATIAVSRFNGCVYCASVHARRYAQLAHSSEGVETFLRIAPGKPLSARLAAIAQFAEKLSATPDRISSSDGAALRSLGFSPLELLDLLHASALFAWANRLMLTLGKPHPPTGKESL